MSETRNPWGWVLALGILSVILGIVAIASPAFVSIATALFFGWLLLFGGILRFVNAFWFKGAANVIFGLLSGVLAVVVGGLIVSDPGTALIGITLALGIFFFGSGLLQIVASVMERKRGGEGFIFTGILTLLLGVIIVMDWPVSGMWVIGAFVGIELLTSGIREIAVAMALKEQGGQLADVVGEVEASLDGSGDKRKQDTA